MHVPDCCSCRVFKRSEPSPDPPSLTASSDEHARDEGGDEEGEESGTEYALNQPYDEVRNGARLRLDDGTAADPMAGRQRPRARSSIIGDGLRTRSPAGQGSEAVLGCEILNRMTALGRPVSYRIGR